MESNKGNTSDTPGGSQNLKSSLGVDTVRSTMAADSKKQANSPTGKDDMSTMRGSFNTKRTSSFSLRVNPENVVKQGLLFKQGKYMKIYKKQYLFFLEKRDEKNDIGPLLKYGRKGKPVAHIIDLSAKPVGQTEGLNGILVVNSSLKDSKFKIIT